MNHFIFSNNGKDHVVRGRDDMLKACGIGLGGKPVVEAVRDGSLLKAMRENEPLPKYRIKKQPLAKSFGGFGRLISELEQLRRGMRA